MYKFGDKVVIRDRSALDGVEGIIYQIKEDRVSILLDKEVIWHVDPCDVDFVKTMGVDTLPAV